MTYITRPSAGMSSEEAYRLLTGAVVPRPIAWITTVDDEGVVNAAPFSSYNYVAHSPPALAVNIASRADGSLKDTARNMLRSREFVVNVATVENLDALHASSAAYAAEVSECATLGIPLEPSHFVRVPRIAASPIQMECRLLQSVPLGDVNTLYIGEVVAFHLSPTVFDGRRIDVRQLQPLARLGGPFYTQVGPVTERQRLE
ncbi:flavin reductase family protein [Hydrogenophaga sp.]|jgi:flavin reductase (DIM6/NTAB) family NADH-FMN oxidoreductase RutF|uniref:flavin reductase family protein n=1 Tax=Hydrogenophaga sp. TaxID=1904254 RepID=UPI003F6E8378